METAAVGMSEIESHELVNLHAALDEPPKLKEIELPEGDQTGFNVDWIQSGHNLKKYFSRDWLDQGYDGVLFKGQGIGATRLQNQHGVDEMIFVGPHNGIVAFKDLTMNFRSYYGRGRALHMGLANPNGPIKEKFCAVLENVEVNDIGIKDPTTDTHGTWGIFGYQCDWILKNVTVSMPLSHEHFCYGHGFAKKGASVVNLTVNGVGGEGLKFTARPSECRWVKDALIHVKNSVFKNWAGPNSWRGGGGTVIQGASANVFIENSRYYGGTTMPRGKCTMFDDSGVDFYGAINGVAGVGPANGHIYIKDTGCALDGESDPWNNNIAWIGALAYSARQKPVHSARSLTIDGCGYYGKNTLWNISGPEGDMIFGKVNFRNCNTPQIRNLMGNMGFRVDAETMIAHPGGLTPLSQGLVIPKN
jgi:hypothetical protein